MVAANHLPGEFQQHLSWQWVAHVGIGSDFDGFHGSTKGLEDVSCYPALLAELLRRGYSKDDLKKIAGLNVLRVLREAEKVAAKLQKDRAR